MTSCWNTQKCMYDFVDRLCAGFRAHERSPNKHHAVPCVENDEDTRCETTIPDLFQSGILLVSMHPRMWAKALIIEFNAWSIICINDVPSA